MSKVNEIRKLLSNNATDAEIARSLKCSRQLVGSVRRGTYNKYVKKRTTTKPKTCYICRQPIPDEEQNRFPGKVKTASTCKKCATVIGVLRGIEKRFNEQGEEGINQEMKDLTEAINMRLDFLSSHRESIYAIAKKIIKRRKYNTTEEG